MYLLREVVETEYYARNGQHLIRLIDDNLNLILQKYYLMLNYVFFKRKISLCFIFL